MSKLEKITILTAAYNSPSKLEGVSRSDEGVCVPEVDTFHETSSYRGASHCDGVCGFADRELIPSPRKIVKSN